MSDPGLTGPELVRLVMGFGFFVFLIYGGYRAGVSLVDSGKHWWRGLRRWWHGSWRFPVEATAIVAGVALVGWGALSFEHEVINWSADWAVPDTPLVVLRYPAWAKAAIVGGLVLAVGGGLRLARQGGLTK